jgi:hypothetical protein
MCAGIDDADAAGGYQKRWHADALVDGVVLIR